MDSYLCIVGFLNSSLRHNGVDTSITLNAAKWNCDGAELSSCVITLFYWIMYYTILNTFGQIYQSTFIVLFYVLIYICFLCIVICMHSFIQHVYSKYAIV